MLAAGQLEAKALMHGHADPHVSLQTSVRFAISPTQHHHATADSIAL